MNCAFVDSRGVRIAALTLTLAVAMCPYTISAQRAVPRDSLVPSLAPKVPLPSEAATANVTKFSFIAYGDTRGRHDGVDV